MNTKPAVSKDTGPLQIRHIFGMNSDVRQDLQLKDHKALFYTAGQYLVKYNIEDKTQDHVPGMLNFSNITAICLSSQKK